MASVAEEGAVHAVELSQQFLLGSEAVSEQLHVRMLPHHHGRIHLLLLPHHHLPCLQRETGGKGGRKVGREGGREVGREGESEGGKEGGREGGRE